MKSVTKCNEPIECVAKSIPEPKERRISFEIRNLSHGIKRYFASKSAKQQAERMTGVHGFIIGYLYDNSDHDIYQREIEEKFNIRRSSVSSVLGLMEKNDLIKREAVEHDARLKKLVLTDKAKKLHERVHEEIEELEETLTKGISQSELDSFMKTLDKLKTNLEEREGKC